MINNLSINPVFKDRISLLKEKKKVLSQLEDIISFSRNNGFDWYFTRIPDLRCGIREVDSFRAEVTLFRVWFRTRGFLRIDFKSTYFNMPISDNNINYIKKYIIEYKNSIGILNRKIGLTPSDYDDRDVEDYSFDRAVAESTMLSSEERLKKIEKTPQEPEIVTREVKVFVRNPNVVAEALYRANGSCQICGKSAPFIRRSNKQPYLEVHHIKPLSKGGMDSLNNVKALCPNCHRKIHHG